MKIRNVIGLLMVCFLFSCSTDILEQEELNEDLEIESRALGDGKYDVLGWSYDATEGYMVDEGIRRPVIDVEKFIEVFGSKNLIVEKPNKRETSSRYGLDKMDYFSTMSIKATGIKSSLFTGDLGGFSKTITDNKQYSYASHEEKIVLKRYKMQFPSLDAETLLSCCTDEFKNDIEQLRAWDLARKWGTHVMISVDLGGKLKANYKSAIIDKEKNYKTLESGLNFGLKEFFSLNYTYEKKLVEHQTQKEIRFTTIGGDPRSSVMDAVNLDGSFSKININNWLQSIDTTNMVFVDVQDNFFIPISEFVTDKTKKASHERIIMKGYIYEYIGKIYKLYAYYNRRDDLFRLTNDFNEYGKGKDGFEFIETYGSCFSPYLEEIKNSPDYVPLCEYKKPHPFGSQWLHIYVVGNKGNSYKHHMNGMTYTFVRELGLVKKTEPNTLISYQCEEMIHAYFHYPAYSSGYSTFAFLRDLLYVNYEGFEFFTDYERGI